MAGRAFARPWLCRRALSFAAWILAFILGTFVFGMLPTILVFAAAFMIAGGERTALALAVAAALTVFCWFVFDELLALPWPDSLLGRLSPALREAVPGI